MVTSVPPERTLRARTEDESGATMSFFDHLVELRKRIISALAAIGVGMVVAGLYFKYHWLAAGGFVVMVLSSAWAVSSYRKMAGLIVGNRGRRSRRRDGHAARSAQSGGLMERIEQRWRRRQEGNR